MTYTSEILIKSAKRWCSTDFGFPPTLGDLRGSTVLAYYAVFHRVAEICAEKIVGLRAENVQDSRAFNEFYRSLKHTTIREACKRAKHSRFSESTVRFFSWFQILQDEREECSYEAFLEISVEQAQANLNTAVACLESLDSIGKEELTEFISLVMLEPKGGVRRIRNRENY